jgi:hypothetical protein
MADTPIHIIKFPRFPDSRGNLTFIQSSDQVPFHIQRVFWTYDISGGESRGGHAYFKQQEVVIALSGSFDVVITDSDLSETRFTLNRSYQGLYLPPRAWRHMDNFSTNSLILHLASTGFQADDYIYDFRDYQNHINSPEHASFSI